MAIANFTTGEVLDQSRLNELVTEINTLDLSNLNRGSAIMSFAGHWAATVAAVATKWDASEIRPQNTACNFFIKINY